MIDIIETVYRGASKGRGLVVSPKGRCATLPSVNDTDLDYSRLLHSLSLLDVSCYCWSVMLQYIFSLPQWFECSRLFSWNDTASLKAYPWMPSLLPNLGNRCSVGSQVIVRACSRYVNPT
jgi:hypothetical protein